MLQRVQLICNHLSLPFTRKANLETPFVAEPLEFLGLQSLLPEDINQKRLQLRAILEEKVAPIIGEYYEKAEFPMEIIPHLQGIDLIGFTQPVAGIKAQQLLSLSLVLYELARIDASLATFIAATIGLAAKSIYLCGTAQQKEKYLPKLANLEIIGGWCLSEPDFGSDASGLQASATRTQGGYLINGVKRWIGNAPMSDILIVYARNTENQQIESFIVNSKSQGISFEDIRHKLALRIVRNGHIQFNNVFVPDEDKLLTTSFADGPNLVLEDSRVIIPWIAVGMIASVFEKAVLYTRERVQFNASLAAMQLTQEKLARILGIFNSTFLQCYHLTIMRQQGQVDVARSSLVKAVVSRMGREAVQLGREMLGGNGILLEMGMMKHLLDMEVVYTYEGTYDINMLVAARTITGVSAIKPAFTLKKQGNQGQFQNWL